MISKIIRFWLSSIFILLLGFAISAYVLYRNIYETPLKIGQDGLVVMITPGMQPNKMVEILAQAGAIKHPKWLSLWIQWTGVRKQLKAGEYFVKPGTTPQGFIELLISGKVMQHELTIVEGWTFERMMQAINEEPALNHTLNALPQEKIMETLGHAGEHPEGRFYPDTYYFPRGTSDVAFLQRSYRVMESKLNKLWENRSPNLSLKSPYQALILASIIEKESSVDSEYAEIAGVYVRRLEKNMPLQADPTVIYGLGKTYPGKLTFDHLKQPSPYNTYLNPGLPPTPIALPGGKALEAAMHPKPGASLYFVAKGKDRNQGHTFSNNITEHEKAVSKYREAVKE